MKRIPLVLAVVAGAISITVPLPFLVLPGVLLAALIWPQGIHTGDGVEHFGYAALALNFMFFAIIFYPIGLLIARRKMVGSVD